MINEFDELVQREIERVNTPNFRNVFGDLELMVFEDQIAWRCNKGSPIIDDLQILSEEFWKEKLQD
jgi:hypothetical protein